VEAEPGGAGGARGIAARDEIEGGRGIVLDVDVGDPASALVGGTVDAMRIGPLSNPGARSPLGHVARGVDLGNRSVADQLCLCISGLASAAGGRPIYRRPGVV